MSVSFSSAFRIAVICVSSGAVTVLGACSKAPEEPEFDYGLKKPLVRKLRAELEETPCDKAKAQEYAQLLMSANDLKGVARASDTFVAACGPNVVLLQLSYTANARQGEKAKALKDATALVAVQPENASYHVWRGLSQEALGQNEGAAADFQKAFDLQPAQRPILNALLKTYDALNRPCDSLAALQRYVEAKPSEAKSADVQNQMKALAQQGSCAADAGKPEAAKMP
ncbi:MULTISPECIES: hypothetical protein [Corallococcus]|uniref:hypothetical protein n=1 Tax=Corallococcus TaxID=83461 RepID=UPI00117F744D|nr:MULTISPECIES: hypothetical protein [Corallococcus]NBD12097.1 hypothetical protein [Corallococcus silvisoli]TSC21622.1 hypothetical protein FOF48_33890 [Corallococcus sp. Z5C101001]